MTIDDVPERVAASICLPLDRSDAEPPDANLLRRGLLALIDEHGDNASLLHRDRGPEGQPWAVSDAFQARGRWWFRVAVVGRRETLAVARALRPGPLAATRGWRLGRRRDWRARAVTIDDLLSPSTRLATKAVISVRLYQPMMTTLTQTLSSAGIQDEVELALADAGYWSEANATSPGPDRLIATLKDHKQRRAARDLGQTSGPPPPDATPIEEMEHLLRTAQGAAAYAQRSCLIEPIFDDRKHNRALRSFRRRGLAAVRSEWAFLHLAANMLKLYQHRAAATTA